MSDKFLTNGAQNRSSSHPKRKPFCVVRHQSASVPIYAHQVHGKTRYTIAFYLDGRRKRRMFTDLKEAKREAKSAAEKIQRGLQSNNDLRPTEREAFLGAQRILKEIDVPLVSAIEEYVRCRKVLGDAPLLASVEEFARRTRGVKLGVSVPEVPGTGSELAPEPSIHNGPVDGGQITPIKY